MSTDICRVSFIFKKKKDESNQLIDPMPLPEKLKWIGMVNHRLL